jgi:CrcB protein
VPLLLLVCLGGAVGSGARYLVQTAAIRSLGADFPHGTLAVNLVGSLLIGIVQHLGLGALAISDTTRIVLATGVLGGFTTYSAFSYETVALMAEGAWGRSILYVSLTTLGCLLACALGVALGRALVAPR